MALDKEPLVLGLDEVDTVPASNEGAVMQVRHPGTGDVLYNKDGVRAPDGKGWDKEPTPMTITLAGRDSDRFKQATRRVIRMRTERNKGRRSPDTSPEQNDNENREILVSCTLGWNITLGDGVTKPEFSPDECRVLYAKYPWLEEQADFFVGDRSNFTRAVAKSS